MSALDRGIGSEGLEQGGPNLGNDYSRKDLSIRDAGSALTSPNTKGSASNDDDQDTLNMDKESSRNLSDPSIDPDDDDDLELEGEDLEEDDLADDDDEEDDELEKGI